ncbi:2OG-Fe(II) oxygenase [Cupriavidus sp. AU9028]|uniref:2OG-Fe(II) oxygenase n=1 Tax=Cupriavidus sp. AU9028 TaxID=2871157 RepID=UPI001C950185|nr:2OG-Fe(II) oxygenase [Cupriavidus sp. AU9028]MBY4897428.1 2OG-Fe(II) oxygenase [Cupriavidus sp. AU9028]
MTTPSQSGTAPSGHAVSSPELERWLERHIALGFDADALTRSMRESGYDAGFARDTVRAALAARRRRGDGMAQAKSQGTTQATEATPAGINALESDRGPVPLLFALESPRIALFDGLLAAAECDALVELARNRLARSPVVNPDTGDENLIEARTSMGAMFQVGEHPLIQRIEARIAQVTGIPAEHGEGLQILNYKPGGEYQPHFDYFNPARLGEARQLRVGGQRVATMVIYLNDVPAGGATAFPRLGLRVMPVRGNAVYFGYRGEDGSLDERTLHAGLPVEQGEKWIATKWLRERPYRAGE